MFRQNRYRGEKVKKENINLFNNRNFWCSFFHMIVDRGEFHKIVIISGRNTHLVDPLMSIFEELHASSMCEVLLTPFFRKTENECDELYIYLFKKKGSYKKNYLTLNDLIALAGWGKVEQVEIPRVFNTIGNCYHNIGLIGHGKFADLIFTYLSKNHGLEIERIDDDCKRGNTYFVNKEYDVVIVLELNRCIVTASKHNRIYSYSLKDYYMAGGVNSEFDIYERVIPSLVESGIEVVGLYQDIDEEQYMKKILKSKKAKNESEHMQNLYSILESESGIEFVQELKQVQYSIEKGYMCIYYNGKSINYVMGRRMVQEGSINMRKPRIFITGPCIAIGTHCKDKETIAYILQSKIKDYNVEIIGGGFRNLNLALREVNFCDGDILLIFDRKNNIINYCKKSHNYSMAFTKVEHIENHILDTDLFHVDGKIGTEIGLNIYDYLCEKNIVKSSFDYSCGEEKSFYREGAKKPVVEMVEDEKFASYLKKMKREYYVENGEINGAIIMTCNPFTLGHKYLIEYASKQVDKLYIFVVEENSFQFSFDDRISMVRAGIADLGNAVVLPSGSYMISSHSLPAYFIKEQDNDAVVDASKDLDMFVYISSALNISKRFVGTEPIDKVTKQYNQSMKDYLARYNIDVVEMPRLHNGENVISASKVRELLAKELYEVLNEYVPESTITYLMNRK